MKRRDILKSLTILPLVGAINPKSVEAEPIQKSGWTPKKVAIPSPYPSKSPLSACIRSGHLVFISGIGGWYADRRKEPGDIQVQIRSALEHMRTLLEKASTNMGNVLKVHMSLAEPNKNIAALNEVYGEYFPDPKPVRSYTGCSLEHMGRDGILVQIDCIAYID
ncbi:MAG: RidA family protein [Bacteroidetes bacterium]|nr:RidA family protein [Bacteroidota bacterium]